MTTSANTKLRKENDRLKKKIARLKAEIECLKGDHKRLKKHGAANIGGGSEKFIHNLIGGEPMPSGWSYDLKVGRKRLEIKGSTLHKLHNAHYAKVGKPNPTNRWNWKHILGGGGNKEYDNLILVGQVDPRHRKHYKDKESPKSPYVIFDVPRRSVEGMVNEKGDGVDVSIGLTSNPAKLHKGNKKSKRLWSEFEVTRAELIKRYSSKGVRFKGR